MKISWPSTSISTSVKYVLALFIALLSTFTLLLGVQANTSTFPLTSILSFPQKALCGPTAPPTHPVKFTQRDEFWDLSAAGDAAWSTLLPANGGFVPHRTETGQAYITGISMFHQLHCLQMIRMAVQKLENATMHAARSEGRGEKGHDHHVGEQRHWVHCLDYLIQSITCAADDTIEPFKGKLVNGYGVVHQCRDSKRLWLWAETPIDEV